MFQDLSWRRQFQLGVGRIYVQLLKEIIKSEIVQTWTWYSSIGCKILLIFQILFQCFLLENVNSYVKVSFWIFFYPFELIFNFIQDYPWSPLSVFWQLIMIYIEEGNISKWLCRIVKKEEINYKVYDYFKELNLFCAEFKNLI